MSGADKQASDWIQFAAEDLAVAHAIHNDRHLPARVACFHCQQSVEKSLKAILIHAGIGFPRTRDLNLLRLLLPDHSGIKGAPLDLSALTVFAAEARYPGDFPDATSVEARDAIAIATKVLELAERELS